MAYSLIRNQFGNYVLNTEDTLKTSGASLPNPKEFEAYGGTQKTELVGGTTLGAQTQEILKREAPGQFNLEYDPATGQYKQKGEVAAVQTQQFKPITSLETGTSQAVQPQQTALEKAQSIISATPYKSGMPDIDVNQLATMFSPQQMSTKQQLLNTVLSTGQDIATSYILDKMGIGGGGIPGGAMSITPLKGGTYPATSFTPTQAGVGGGIAAAAGTLLAGGSIKDAAKTGVATGIGTAIGTSVGGPIGGVIGGAIGSIIGCFLPDTLITMADGSKKKIIDIELKDNIEIGGKVFATGKFLVNNLFDYKGIKVSGDHLVNESGKWLKVKNSKFAKSLGDDEHVVYTLGSENRRILINNILFTDYFDFEEQKAVAA